MDIPRIGMDAYAGKVICTLAAVLLLASPSMAGQKSPSPSKASSAGAFDTPIKKVTINFGTPADPTKQHILVCHYYPHLLVKEYAPYGIGTDWLSILRSPGKLPACKRSHEPGARIIKYPEWDGFFKGVKGHLVFFDNANPFNGGYAFVIYDSVTGKRLFKDTAYYHNDSSRVRVFSTKRGYLLRYLRVADVGCDLYAKGTDCWKKTKAKFGLKSDHKPVCKGYPWAYTFFATNEVDSMIDYPVEVTLSPHPTIKPIAGTIKCWPTD